MNPKNFLTELKRRNVYRAAVAYGVVAWFLTQVTTQVFPFFEIPNSAVRFVVIALAVGFPIAMLLSWLYEFTPAGVVRTEDLQPAQARSAQRTMGRILDFITIGALLLVIAMLVVGRLPFYRQSGESISQKSIAVLPFENLSADPENAFFTDGVQDEILNDLAKIADLKVISRTSVMQYKGVVKRNVREIANELGVAHVIEGSVQRPANRVRVTAQLIDARTDTHLWVERYDRPLDDVFAIQSDIAKEIAAQLQAKLSSNEKSAIEERPTKDLEAYDLYVRAKLLMLKGLINEGNLVEPARLLNQAIARDPDFFLAYCLLAEAHSHLYSIYDHTPARRDLADRAVKAALYYAGAFFIGKEEMATSRRSDWMAFPLTLYADQNQLHLSTGKSPSRLVHCWKPLVMMSAAWSLHSLRSRRIKFRLPSKGACSAGPHLLRSIS